MLEHRPRWPRNGPERLIVLGRKGALKILPWVSRASCRAAELDLPIRSFATLAQGKEPGEPGGTPRGAGGLGQEALVSESIITARDWRRRPPLPLRVTKKLDIHWCWIKCTRCPRMRAVAIAPYSARLFQRRKSTEIRDDRVEIRLIHPGIPGKGHRRLQLVSIA